MLDKATTFTIYFVVVYGLPSQALRLGLSREKQVSFTDPFDDLLSDSTASTDFARITPQAERDYAAFIDASKNANRDCKFLQKQRSHTNETHMESEAAAAHSRFFQLAHKMKGIIGLNRAGTLLGAYRVDGQIDSDTGGSAGANRAAMDVLILKLQHLTPTQVYEQLLEVGKAFDSDDKGPTKGVKCTVSLSKKMTTTMQKNAWGNVQEVQTHCTQTQNGTQLKYTSAEAGSDVTMIDVFGIIQNTERLHWFQNKYKWDAKETLNNICTCRFNLEKSFCFDSPHIELYLASCYGEDFLTPRKYKGPSSSRGMTDFVGP